MKNIYFFLLTLCLWLSCTSLYAQTITLGASRSAAPTPDNLLSIKITDGGSYCVYRWINDVWQQQFFDADKTPLFAIKIGDTTFSHKAHGSILSGVTLVDFDLIQNIGTPVTTGINQEMTKRFTGTYNGNTFSVTVRILYNTSSPDYFLKYTTIDATNIPAGTPITLAYGWDTFVNTNDNGYAYIVPDDNNYNNSSNLINWYLTTADVQSLRMVGARNTTGNGAIIAFFPVGRVFDRAYSANPFTPGYCYNIPTLTPGNGTNSGSNSQYKFQFGPYDKEFNGLEADNGTGVGYDNIPAGQITEIKTGLTFTAALDGELDYFWNGVKNHTANIGDNVTLDLGYTSYSPVILTNVGFRIDHTGLQISGACTSSGFTEGTSNCTSGNEFYQLSGASVATKGTSTVSVPVNIVRAGKWVVDGSSISNMTQTLPLGNPAILTVKTTASLSDNSEVVLSAGKNSHQFTVKFPDAVVANENVTVNINYSGDISDFSSLPSSVVIPAGQNSATFTVTAASDATNGSNIIVTLSGTDKEFAIIAPPSSVVVNYINPVSNCTNCPSSFAPIPGKEYIISAWVKEPQAYTNGTSTYEHTYISLVFELIGGGKHTVSARPTGNIIDGWQRIHQDFLVPANAYKMRIRLKNEGQNIGDAFFDDIRVHPVDATMKSYVYDPETLRLTAELDEQNYATFYDYDEEGNLIRIRKETEKGIMTIREARQGKPKKQSTP